MTRILNKYFICGSYDINRPQAKISHLEAQEQKKTDKTKRVKNIRKIKIFADVA